MFFFRYFFIFITKLTVNNRKTSWVFFIIYDILVFLNSLYLLQILHYVWTYLDFIENILSFFLYSLNNIHYLIFLYLLKTKCVCTKKLFSFNIKINKSNTKISTFYWIICFYSVNIRCNILIANEFSNFFSNMLNSTTSKVSNIFSIDI